VISTKAWPNAVTKPKASRKSKRRQICTPLRWPVESKLSRNTRADLAISSSWFPLSSRTASIPNPDFRTLPLCRKWNNDARGRDGEKKRRQKSEELNSKCCERIRLSNEREVVDKIWIRMFLILLFVLSAIPAPVIVPAPVIAFPVPSFVLCDVFLAGVVCRLFRRMKTVWLLWMWIGMLCWMVEEFCAIIWIWCHQCDIAGCRLVWFLKPWRPRF